MTTICIKIASAVGVISGLTVVGLAFNSPACKTTTVGRTVLGVTQERDCASLETLWPGIVVSGVSLLCAIIGYIYNRVLAKEGLIFSS